MEQQDQKVILEVGIAKLLLQLAIVKHQERSEKQIAAMAAYLAKHFSFQEVSQACEYFLQRSPFMPGIDSFFTVLRPICTLEQRAIELTGEFEEAIRTSGANYQVFMDKSSPELQNLVTKYGWHTSQGMYKKDLIEAFKSITNQPNFFLSTIRAPEHEKTITAD